MQINKKYDCILGLTKMGHRQEIGETVMMTEMMKKIVTETENCGGEPCTATEKEDSWVDDETKYEEEPECFENNDGALGDPIPCEQEISDPRLSTDFWDHIVLLWDELSTIYNAVQDGIVNVGSFTILFVKSLAINSKSF